MRIIIYCLFICFSTALCAQNAIKGQVTDAQGEALAFVNILVNGNPSEGITSDIDGQFLLETKTKLQFLEFRYVGYETLLYTVRQADYTQAILVQMYSANFDLVEAVVVAGENPAHRIIRQVVNNRKQNQPAFLDSYQCQTYNKIRFDFLPNEAGFEKHLQKRAAKGKTNPMQQRRDSVTMMYQEFAKTQHLMLIETLTKKQFVAPNKTHEEVLMNQVSGFQDPHFVALAKDAQPFSFYEPQLQIVGNTFLNPISKGSTKAYFFELQDTLYQQQDSIFIISFQPKKGKTFDGLKGVLYIHTKQFAIQNVVAEPADSSLTKIVIEQKYQYHPDAQKWFPEQLNFEWAMPKYPSPYVGLKIVGKSYISEVDFVSQPNTKSFTADKYVLGKNANRQADSTWQKTRPIQLDEKEKATYVWWDTIPGARKVEQIFNLSESLVSGVYPLGKLNVDIPRLLDVNDYEKARIGLGLHTNSHWNERWKIGGFVGYGLRDKGWKYGGDIRFNIQANRDFYTEIGYHKDTRVPGIPQFPQLQYSTRFFDRGLYDFRMDDVVNIYGKVGFTVLKNAHLQLGISQNSWQTNYEYALVNDEGQAVETGFDFTEITLGLRYAMGEQYVPFMGTKMANPTRKPILQFQLTKGMDLFNQGHPVFVQYLTAIEQQLPLKRWGKLSYRIEGAWSSPKVRLPYSKLFSQSGVGTGFQVFNFGNTFQTMGQYEFLSDKYIALFLEYNLGTLSKKSKFFQPELAFLQNAAFGTLAQPEWHQNIAFKTLEKGFFESGLALNNLLRFNYLNMAYIGLGWATYLRYGDNAFPDLSDNLAHRLTIDFDF